MQISQLTEKFNDHAFQSELQKNPHKALQKVGVKLPSSTEIKVVCNTSDSLHVVIPVSDAESVFTDEQLEDVAAGEIFITLAIVGGVVGGGVLVAGAAIGIMAATGNDNDLT